MVKCPAQKLQQHMLSVEEKESGSLIFDRGRFDDAGDQNTAIEVDLDQQVMTTGEIGDGLEPSDTIVKHQSTIIAGSKRNGSNEVSLGISSALIKTVSSALEHFAQSHKQFKNSLLQTPSLIKAPHY